MTLRASRRGLPVLLGALALAACAGPPPQPAPAPDMVAAPGSLFTLSPGTPVDGNLRLTLRRGQPNATGILASNGQNIPVTLTGLTVQGGGARVDLRGQVYGLPRGGSDFPGTYNIVDGGSGSDLLTGGLRLGSDKLVLIVMQPPREGMVLGVAQGGVVARLGR